MAGRKSDFTLTKLDDLFTTQAQRDEEQLSKIRDIPLELIDDFPDHPFKVRDDEDMMQLVESVKEQKTVESRVLEILKEWPSPTDEQKEKIKKTAQAILNARALYPNSSLADLYDPLTMPPELLKAHNANNRAVMEAYGFSTKMSEADCVAELMKMYQKLTEEK